ncbi:hypothetical protein RvY_16652 [Ramazzottius varieornatus]|uniref:Uncharacterized protein n=1 Tax=Ramazzottius varieornatus TaxID=947166 RepID=A0A1D1VZ91_RAMVA|nr:hypothetical protein RvY_16652 [Ramazzottius varieornatus]
MLHDQVQRKPMELLEPPNESRQRKAFSDDRHIVLLESGIVVVAKQTDVDHDRESLDD